MIELGFPRPQRRNKGLGTRTRNVLLSLAAVGLVDLTWDNNKTGKFPVLIKPGPAHRDATLWRGRKPRKQVSGKARKPRVIT